MNSKGIVVNPCLQRHLQENGNQQTSFIESMRKPPKNNSGRPVSTRSKGIATTNKNKPPHPVADARDDADSGYYSLQSIVSSDSRDDSEDLTREMNLLDKEERETSLLDKEETYHCSVTESSSGEGSQQSKNPIARLRSSNRSKLAPPPGPPPPPSMPPPSHHADNSRQPSSRRNISTSSGHETFDKSHPSGTATPASQKKALLTLLQEMRTLEQQLHQQTHDYTQERTALMQSLEQKSKYIAQLEHSQQSLQKQNDVQKRQLAGILTKLDKFATGCWKFSSASVKKMSEALHIQVNEWGRLYSIDTSNGLSSPSEDEAMERTTMEKIQSMHVEIKQLKKDNHVLKGRIKKQRSAAAEQRSRKQKRGAYSNGESDSKSVVSSSSGFVDNSDEVSHLSGITQMTATTAMTSTSKLMDAMSGFLNEHDEGSSKQDEDKVSELQHQSSASSSPKSKKPHKKTVQIASPRSILKHNSKYDHRLNDQRVRLQQQHQHKQSMKQQSSQRQSHQDPHKQSHSPPPVQHKPLHPGLPKSPKPGLPRSPNIIRGNRNKGASHHRHGSMGFANFSNDDNDDGFANFDNAFGATNDENQMWPTSSWGGDELSEV